MDALESVGMTWRGDSRLSPVVTRLGLRKLGAWGKSNGGGCASGGIAQECVSGIRGTVLCSLREIGSAPHPELRTELEGLGARPSEEAVESMLLAAIRVGSGLVSSFNYSSSYIAAIYKVAFEWQYLLRLTRLRCIRALLFRRQ